MIHAFSFVTFVTFVSFTPGGESGKPFLASCPDSQHCIRVLSVKERGSLEGDRRKIIPIHMSHLIGLWLSRVHRGKRGAFIRLEFLPSRV